MKEFAKNLQKIREQKGLSKSKLSCEIGRSPSYIGKLEAGTINPTIDNVQEIAKVLGCSSGDLTGESVLPRIASSNPNPVDRKILQEVFDAAKKLLDENKDKSYTADDVLNIVMEGYNAAIEAAAVTQKEGGHETDKQASA